MKFAPALSLALLATAVQHVAARPLSRRTLAKVVGASPAILAVTGAKAQEINLLEELKGAKDELLDKAPGLNRDPVSEFKAPDIKIPEFKKPDIKLPEVKMPNIKMPDVKMPDVKMPDVKMPDVKMPDVKMPDVKMPDVKMPDVKMPDVKVPDVKLPEVTTPAVPSSSLPKFSLPSFSKHPEQEEEEAVAPAEKSFVDKLKPYLYTFGGGFGLGSLVGGRVGWAVRGLAFATEQAKNSAISKSSEAITGLADSFKGNPFKGPAQSKKSPPPKAPAAKAPVVVKTSVAAKPAVAAKAPVAAKVAPSSTTKKATPGSTPRIVKLEESSSQDAKDVAEGEVEAK